MGRAIELRTMSASRGSFQAELHCVYAPCDFNER